MIFNSSQFIIFFIAFFGLYYAWPRKPWQIAVLLLASAMFYGWSNPWLLLLLLFCISLNAVTSWIVCQSSSRRLQVLVATIGLAINLALLGAFKYAGMVEQLLRQVFGASHSFLGPVTFLAGLPLPIGISFFTFEGICLVVDTLRGTAPKQSPSFGGHLRNTALFISFFPHLIAGPIVRPAQFFEQIEAKRFRDIDWNYVSAQLIIGYFLKIVIADNLAELTDMGFRFFQAYSSLNLLAIVVAYSVRIFSDFAGYCYIALGLAAALGYRLPINFNWPYRSQSLSEFWKRWNMTLSAWLRDYLYIPLGGNRLGSFRTYLNLMIVMLLGGLWHGAHLRYAVWGVLHGVGLCLERSLGLHKHESNSPALQTLRIIAVFAFVSFAWLLFVLPVRRTLQFCKYFILNLGWTPYPVSLVAIALLCLPVLLWHWIAALEERGFRMPSLLQTRLAWDVTLALMLFFIFANPGEPKTFVYFQF